MSDYPPPEKPLDISNEFMEAVTQYKSIDNFQKFVEDVENLHPDDRRKVFYNIAQKIKELSHGVYFKITCMCPSWLNNTAF